MSDGRFAFAEGDLTQSYTASTLPAGYAVGMLRREANKTYVLVKATGSIAVNGICKTDTAAITPYFVVASAAATDIPRGVNESGARVSGDFFWLTIGGSTQTKVTGTLSASDPISVSGTAATGQKAPFTAATVQGVLGHMLEANASGAATKAVFLLGLY